MLYASYTPTWIVADDSTGVQLQPVPFDHLPAAHLAEQRDAVAAFNKRWAQLTRIENWQGSPVVTVDLKAHSFNNLPAKRRC